MYYEPISIRKAVQNINETWFLPAIQRPYDWGGNEDVLILCQTYLQQLEDFVNEGISLNFIYG